LEFRICFVFRDSYFEFTLPCSTLAELITYIVNFMTVV
jgi:hypothetical protein